MLYDIIHTYVECGRAFVCIQAFAYSTKEIYVLLLTVTGKLTLVDTHSVELPSDNILPIFAAMQALIWVKGHTKWG